MRLLPLVAALFLVSCGGSSSPTAPQGPQYPAVAGSYAGTVTIVLPEIQQSVTCPATTVVTQTGANVSMAPIILGGGCGISIPIGSFSIDTNGAFPAYTQTFYEPSCGGNYTSTTSGGFFGRQFQASMSAVSSVCLNMNITAVLTR